MSETPIASLADFVNQSFAEDEILQQAVEHAEEFGVAYPDPATGSLLSLLSASVGLRSSSGVVVAAEAANVVGYYVARGLNGAGLITCIEPDVEHQQAARTTLKALNVPESTTRFMPAQPHNVLARLAQGKYGLVIADVPGRDLKKFIAGAWPLLSEGGVLVLLDCLLDGTIADESRSDRDTVGARDALESLNDLSDAVVARVPLGAGAVLLTKTAASSDE